MTDEMDREAIIRLMQELGRLKVLPRTGWQFRGIKFPESIADHCYRMSMLAMVLADVLAAKGVAIDASKVARMALVHELAEARIGDIPVVALRHLPAEAKRQAEREAVHEMLAGLGPVQAQYLALWEEFETGNSLEAQLTRAADKLELIFQAADYERLGYRGLDEFWEKIGVMPSMDTHPLVRSLYDQLAGQRPKITP